MQREAPRSHPSHTTASVCCDWKARMASAQRFSLWQQATARDHTSS